MRVYVNVSVSVTVRRWVLGVGREVDVPWRDGSFGVDDALPWDVFVVEAGCRVCGEVFEADAYLTGAFGFGGC